MIPFFLKKYDTYVKFKILFTKAIIIMLNFNLNAHIREQNSNPNLLFFQISIYFY